MSNDIDLDEFDAPERPDFRRVGRGVPYVVGVDGKRVRYSRSSNAGKVLDDDSNLTDWKLRTVVAGAAQRPELLAMASTLDIDQDKKKLRDIAEECLVAGKGQRRAIIGTAVHAMFDHIDRDDGWVPPPQFNDLIDAYVATLEVWGLVPVGIELHCINDEFHLAGTCDRHYRTTKTLVAPDGQVIPIGSVIVADTKTGKELEYAAGSYATQLAAYVDSVQYDVETDERIPWETAPNGDWALIIHADSGDTRVDVYWVDIRAGRLGLQLAREVRAWRKRDDLLTLGQRFRVVDPPNQSPTGVEGPEPGSPATGADTLPPLASSPPTDPPSVPPVVPQDVSRVASRREYLRGRVKAVLAHSETAGKALQRGWPTGVPGLAVDAHDMDSLDAIQRAIIKVETDHSVPWYPEWDDPEMAQSMREHPSNRWAKPSSVKDQSDEATAARLAIQNGLANHPRRELINQWIAYAMSGTVDPDIDTTAVAHALYEFARVDAKEWPDDDLTVMLNGALRAMGYRRGIRDLGAFDPPDAPVLMSAAFAIAAGNATLLIEEDGEPLLITDVITKHL